MTRYFTVAETAEQLERDTATITDWLDLGIIPSVHVPGNGPVIPGASVPPFTRPSESEA